MLKNLSINTGSFSVVMSCYYIKLTLPGETETVLLWSFNLMLIDFELAVGMLELYGKLKLKCLYSNQYII